MLEINPVYVALIAVFAVTVVAYTPLWYWGRRTSGLSIVDWIHPFAAPFVWVVLTAIGVGAQSLGNLIELLIAVAVGWVLYLLVLALPIDRPHAQKVRVATCVMIVFVVGLRLFTPLIPE